MTLEDATYPFEFNPDPVSVNDLIVCRTCCQSSPVRDWQRGEFIFCEDCGEHTALRCPICAETFDHVFADPFQVIRSVEILL